MHSEWRVTSNLINGKKMYAVYRLIDTSEIDHAGNREFGTRYMPDRMDAEEIAIFLNEKESPHQAD